MRCPEFNGHGPGCLDRIWVHRVNTIERYDILKDQFEGFETDIVYDDSLQTYFVYHPPKPVDEEILPLKEFLKHVDFKWDRLWLDTRGVDSSNMQRALLSLKQLVDTTIIQYPVIVELYDISAAKLFSENGFLVSFNVSEQLLVQLRTDLALRDSLNFKVLKEVHFVSQDYRYIPQLKQCFMGKSIITWHPEFNAFVKPKELQKILDDMDVFIVLVGIKSRYYR